ncbi:hypothetical protein GRJ2_001670500 [Grus japonensis]|uniref:Uncharacterized protein n=1 Tax=Grus japonensis TaxID=30415 RepID=A0ABC9X543_GRUJA
MYLALDSYHFFAGYQILYLEKEIGYLVNEREIDFADGGSKTREGNLGEDKWKSGDRLNEEEEGRAEEQDST